MPCGEEPGRDAHDRARRRRNSAARRLVAAGSMRPKLSSSRDLRVGDACGRARARRGCSVPSPPASAPRLVVDAVVERQRRRERAARGVGASAAGFAHGARRPVPCRPARGRRCRRRLGRRPPVTVASPRRRARLAGRGRRCSDRGRSSAPGGSSSRRSLITFSGRKCSFCWYRIQRSRVDVAGVELPVPRRRALGIDEALALEEADLRDRDVGELVAGAGASTSPIDRCSGLAATHRDCRHVASLARPRKISTNRPIWSSSRSCSGAGVDPLVVDVRAVERADVAHLVAAGRPGAIVGVAARHRDVVEEDVGVGVAPERRHRRGRA